jgi:3',5'-cyclic-AMP phosphodiesterase
MTTNRHAMMAHIDPQRRALLGAGLAGALAGALGCSTGPRSATGREGGGRSGSQRLLRIAHLTDMHVQPERRAGEGFAMALTHVNTLAGREKPDVLITGGDLIFSGFEKDEARTRTQWDLFTKVLAERNQIQTIHCLGNHDIWGWNKKESGTTGAEAQWGKRWAVDLLQLPAPFARHDVRGVRILVLDSVQPSGDGYEGGLDDPQFEWLAGELAATPATMPVIVVTHIPIFHASTLLVDARMDEQRRKLTGAGAIFVDANRVAGLLTQYPNVRAVLSGHIHMAERIEYAGIHWINSGAVSGAWWRSQEKSKEFMTKRGDTTPNRPNRPNRADPGYTLVDLFADGSVAWQYVQYGWTPVEA